MASFDFFAALNRIGALVVLNRPQGLGPALPLDSSDDPPPTHDPEPEPKRALNPEEVVASLDRMERDVDRGQRQQQQHHQENDGSSSRGDDDNFIRYLKLVEKAYHDSSRLARLLATELAEKSNKLLKLQEEAQAKLDDIKIDTNKTLHLATDVSTQLNECLREAMEQGELPKQPLYGQLWTYLDNLAKGTVPANSNLFHPQTLWELVQKPTIWFPIIMVLVGHFADSRLSSRICRGLGIRQPYWAKAMNRSIPTNPPHFRLVLSRAQ